MQLRLKSSNILLGGKYKASPEGIPLCSRRRAVSLCGFVWFIFLQLQGENLNIILEGQIHFVYLLVYLLGINLVERCADLYRLKSDQFTRSKS